MIKLSSIINTFESDLFVQYENALLPSHVKAINAMKCCRSDYGLKRIDN
jgi:hypothetical protein